MDITSCYAWHVGISSCFSKLSGRPLSCRLTDKVLPLKCSSERRRYQVPPNFPVRIRPSDVIELGGDKKVF
ncbi:hypothetical protein BHE74_00016651 [Ensete ventricosum]|nr:hypothetical protein BHE74_00016651 [Ensete ventricosum]